MPITLCSARALSSAALIGVLCWLSLGLLLPNTASAQDQTVAPRDTVHNIRIDRGQDIVQPPSLWYQEGDAAPDSLGIIRVPRTDDPDEIRYPDANRGYPVYLQHATFVRDGQVAEVSLSDRVLSGEVQGRIIIRPPADDFYDIAEPFEVGTIRQEPGVETIIDAREWYRASLINRRTGLEATADAFQATRELRGRLRSTATGGESVLFYLVASRPTAREIQQIQIVGAPRSIIERPVPVTRFLTIRETPPPQAEWITRVGVFAGPNSAGLPALQEDRYTALRIRGDFTSTLRLNVGNSRSFDVSIYSATQPTLSPDGNHHDVPYGIALAARFGVDLSFVLQAIATYEDSPFQTQGFDEGDQRLRLLVGLDKNRERSRYQLRLGPTYFRDQPGVLPGDNREPARELGYSAYGRYISNQRVAGRPFVWESDLHVDQSWGYVQDTGNSNFIAEGRTAFKREFTVGSGTFSIGPAVFGQYINNIYSETAGFDEFSILFGFEMTSRAIL
jgi:hypothetical protein